MSALFPPDDEASPEPPGRRTPRRRRRRSRGPAGILAGLAVAVVAVAIAGVLYVVSIDRAVNQTLERGNHLPVETPTTKGERPRPAKKVGSTALNYVLLGSDSRAAGNAGAGRSDVLMVLHLSGDRRNAYLISFPRDMYVAIPGHGKNKINAAFAFGGPQLTVRTVEGLLGTRMDHVALIDFDGFIALTEELGGVTVTNRHPSVSGGYSFPKGRVTLRGEQALAYVRERKQLPRGDLDRAERQRAVLQAILGKGLSGDTIANPKKFLAFSSGVAAHVTVDDQLTRGEMRETALSLRLTPGDVHSLQAPISGFGTTADKQSIDVVDQQKLAELARALQTDDLGGYLEKYPTR